MRNPAFFAFFLLLVHTAVEGLWCLVDEKAVYNTQSISYSATSSTRQIAFALPLWSAHQIDAETQETVKACLMGIVIFPIAIPWPYVLANYVEEPGDRWK